MNRNALISLSLLMLLAAASFVSCEKDVAAGASRLSGEGEMIEITVVPGELTKSGGGASLTEASVSKLCVMLFNGSALYASKSTPGSSVTFSVNAGTYDIIAVANDSFFSSGTTSSNASQKTSAFWNESKSAFRMCGKKLGQPLTSSGTVTIPMTRLVSRVVLESVTYDISGTNIAPGTDFLLKKAFLTNVWTECGYGDGTVSLSGFGPTAVDIPDYWLIDETYGAPWINYHGLEAFSSPATDEPDPGTGTAIPISDTPTIDDPVIVPEDPTFDIRSTQAQEMLVKDYGSSPLAISSGETAEPVLTFYTYPNSSLATAPEASTPCTRLVLYGTIGTEEVYYHVDLPGMLPNASYNIDVFIYNYGGFDEEHNYEKPSLEFSCSVSQWETGTNQTYVFE